MNNWLNGAIERAETLTDWLAPQRQTSLQLLKEAGWPTRKTEDWKYFPLRAVEDSSFSSTASNESVSVELIDELDSIDLIFVDGCLESGSDDLPEGLLITSIAELNGDSAKQLDNAWVEQVFSTVKPTRHVFGLVNDVLASDGVLIDIAANAKIEAPIRIVNVVSSGVESHTRIVVRLGCGSKASVIEQSVGDQAGFSTLFAEYLISDDATLEHYRFSMQTGAALNIGGSHFKLANRSKLNSTLVGFGSKLSRLDVDVEHAGEHAFAKLNAIYMLNDGDLFDLHSTIEHAQPHGTTEENVRGIVGDRSKAIFNGRIHIHRHAQKTLAELNNRNLLLSDRAEINTKPELEIYADDVRCAHGATVAEVDKQALYYLQSRGVSKGQAQVMLNFGFINELIDDMPNQILADWLRPQLRQRFAEMEIK
jgi:Fe-S cluster assembly protein SufD